MLYTGPKIGPKHSPGPRGHRGRWRDDSLPRRSALDRPSRRGWRRPPPPSTGGPSHLGLYHLDVVGVGGVGVGVGAGASA